MNEASVSKETESERRGAEGSEPSGKATMTASMCGGAELRLEDRREWSVGGETGDVDGDLSRCRSSRAQSGECEGESTDGREYNDADEGRKTSGAGDGCGQRTKEGEARANCDDVVPSRAQSGERVGDDVKRSVRDGKRRRGKERRQLESERNEGDGEENALAQCKGGGNKSEFPG
ncbi:hypothetical protein F5148DRAFT_1369742 [Russula earlei]|uniref:Uncharacterized protein n=1 Tax=Russula earlei TaxID=71964 RepID=A0ACC0U0L4_9AGAM|nr:hypothetical protein F5148DRAFT_1369742 [Russula earlei]